MSSIPRTTLAFAFALSVLATLGGWTRTAHADGASGTWSGLAEARGNYYWERSTRVVSPGLELSLESPTGVRVGGHYAVDSITSASQATGVVEDVSFTEVRHEGSLRGGYEFDLGDAKLALNADFRVSREPDYVSLGGGLTAAISLDDRSTVLRFGVHVLRDSISQVLRDGAGVRPLPDGTTTADVFNEAFSALAFDVAWEQLLAPWAFFQLSYQYGYLDGYLANAYRMVAVVGSLRPENHPDTRHRHTATGRLALHANRTGSSLHLIYRAYIDSWDIAAITPEVRIYQELSRNVTLRVRWRHYRQRRSFFYEEQYADALPEDAPVTADPKMSTFHSNLLGFQLLVGLGFLEESKLDFLGRASIDLTFEYIGNTIRFGIGVISQLVLRAPFGVPACASRVR